MAESFFNKQDIGIVQICAINDSNSIIPVEFSRIESLFHELCHAFHYISGTRKENKDRKNLEQIYRNVPRGIELWQGNRKCDEEFYTITGINNQTYAPINSNIFDAYESILHKKPIRQRSIYEAYNPDFAIEPSFEKVIEATLPILEYPKKYFIDIV